MAISDEEKNKIMQDLASGNPNLPTQQPSPFVKLESDVNYQNFDDFAQRSSTEIITKASLDSLKAQIQTDLKQAKETGQLRASRIKEIVQSAVSEVSGELKSGSSDIRSIVRDAISTVVENVQEKGGEITEEITASIEGAIEGVSTWQRRSISKTQAEVKQLQVKLESEEDQLQKEIDRILGDVEAVGKDTPPKINASIEAAIKAVKDGEGVAMLQERYAKLQAQAAILRANLAARYGGRYEEVKEHLDDAKAWYGKARPQAEAVANKLEDKRSHVEQKLGDAGVALAQKERRIRQILSELLHAASENLKDKEPPKK